MAYLKLPHGVLSYLKLPQGAMYSPEGISQLPGYRVSDFPGRGGWMQGWNSPVFWILTPGKELFMGHGAEAAVDMWDLIKRGDSWLAWSVESPTASNLEAPRSLIKSWFEVGNRAEQLPKLLTSGNIYLEQMAKVLLDEGGWS